MFAADARETGTVRGGVCRDFATVQRQRRTCGDVRAATGETRDVTLDSGVGQDERRSAVHAHAGAVFGRDVGHHARVGHAGRALRVHEDATTDLSLVFVERESVEIGVRVRVDDDARAPEQRAIVGDEPGVKGWFTADEDTDRGAVRRLVTGGDDVGERAVTSVTDEETGGEKGAVILERQSDGGDVGVFVHV